MRRGKYHGLLARLTLIQIRSLGFDEILTLVLARYPVGALLEALRLESNAPFHYLVAKLVLWPVGPDPDRLDSLVRYVSLGCGVLHLPLLPRLARRLGVVEAGPRAMGLYALAPLAVYHDSEARAYSLTSLLVLYAFDQALALRQDARRGPAVRLALAAACAVLAHLNALFPLVGFAFLFRRGGRAALLFGLAGGAAALLAAPWLAVAVHQPAGAIAWVNLIPRSEAVARVAVNLTFAADQEHGRGLVALLALGCAFLGLAWHRLRGQPGGRDLMGVLGLGVVSLAALALARPTILGPGRVAVSFIPLACLLAAMAGRAASGGFALVAAACLLQQAPAWSAESPVDRLATSLEPAVRSGWSVCGVGIYGPELNYKLRLAEPRASVFIFPSDVARHRGWHDDSQPADDILQAEARAMTQRPRPILFVLPWGARASAALGAELRRLDATPWGRSAYVEIVALPVRP